MTLEIETTRGLAAQILRHRSFTFQEFSQRYADTNLIADKIPLPELRRQDTKNRQNSIDDIPDKQVKDLHNIIEKYFAEGLDLYNELIREGIAKECARFVLPLATPTRIYMTGSCRSWGPLYRFEVSTWNSKGTYGGSRSLPKYIRRTVPYRC